MDKDDLSTLLTQSAPGETVSIEEDRLQSIFGHGDERTRREASQFAEEHNCDFVFDEPSRRANFIKREHPPSARAKAV